MSDRGGEGDRQQKRGFPAPVGCRFGGRLCEGAPSQPRAAAAVLLLLRQSDRAEAVGTGGEGPARQVRESLWWGGCFWLSQTGTLSSGWPWVGPWVDTQTYVVTSRDRSPSASVREGKQGTLGHWGSPQTPCCPAHGPVPSPIVHGALMLDFNVMQCSVEQDTGPGRGQAQTLASQLKWPHGGRVCQYRPPAPFSSLAFSQPFRDIPVLDIPTFLTRH